MYEIKVVLESSITADAKLLLNEMIYRIKHKQGIRLTLLVTKWHSLRARNTVVDHVDQPKERRICKIFTVHVF